MIDHEHDATWETGHHSVCQVCGWLSREWPTHHQAGCEATWHVYENHPKQWRALFGSKPPTDPDPRIT